MRLTETKGGRILETLVCWIGEKAVRAAAIRTSSRILLSSVQQHEDQ
jgi:hypothetical protein